MNLYPAQFRFTRRGSPVSITRRALAALLEYNTTVPTGAQPGLRWRVDANFYARRFCGFLHPFDGTPEPEACGECWWIACVLAETHPLGGHVIEFSPALIVEAAALPIGA